VGLQNKMEKYNYNEAVKNDVVAYIEENVNLNDYESREALEEQLNDDLFCCDSITGNGSGSYTFNTWEAEENLCHNMKLLAEACNELGGDFAELVERGAEACDVTIRCYLLSSAISEVLDDIYTEL
jgi:hypothetical protein